MVWGSPRLGCLSGKLPGPKSPGFLWSYAQVSA
nr:MAG TPA: hypothetical protein [Caudoviricetes sp.]